jgi:hypothetical protein
LTGCLDDQYDKTRQNYRLLRLKAALRSLKISHEIKEWPGKMIYLNFDSIFGDFFLKFFEEEVSDYLS